MSTFVTTESASRSATPGKEDGTWEFVLEIMLCRAIFCPSLTTSVGRVEQTGEDTHERLGRPQPVCRRHTAREIVLALIVDDGVRGGGHRKNIFNLTYNVNVAAAAYGSHARFGSVCSIDFASDYAENRLVRAGSDPQNSF